MITTTFTCDGCDARQTLAYREGKVAQPEGWLIRWNQNRVLCQMCSAKEIVAVARENLRQAEQQAAALSPEGT